VHKKIIHVGSFNEDMFKRFFGLVFAASAVGNASAGQDFSTLKVQNQLTNADGDSVLGRFTSIAPLLNTNVKTL